MRSTDNTGRKLGYHVGEARTQLVCVRCREANGGCSHERISLHPNWRPPRKTNNRAWRRVAEGDYLWDKRRNVLAIVARGGKFSGWRSWR